MRAKNKYITTSKNGAFKKEIYNVYFVSYVIVYMLHQLKKHIFHLFIYTFSYIVV